VTSPQSPVSVAEPEYLPSFVSVPQQAAPVDFTSDDNVYASLHPVDPNDPDPMVDHGGYAGLGIGVGWPNINPIPSEEEHCTSSYTLAQDNYGCEAENILMDCGGFDDHLTSSFRQLIDDECQMIQPDYIFSNLLSSDDFASLAFESH